MDKVFADFQTVHDPLDWCRRPNFKTGLDGIDIVAAAGEAARRLRGQVSD
jgi:hypothetical protein